MKANNNMTYKFRAECAADAQAVRAVLLPWLMEWQETRDNMNYEDALHAMPDMTVEFSLVEEGPSLDEMLWLLDGIDNGHVASDTLATIESYTGERGFRGAFESPARRPNKEVLRRALVAVRARQQVLGLELERALQLHRTYEAASRLGDKWQPFSPDEPSPGWLVAFEHKPSGLTALRRIRAPLGCKNWEKKGDGIVKARTLTISA